MTNLHNLYLHNTFRVQHFYVGVAFILIKKMNNIHASAFSPRPTDRMATLYARKIRRFCLVTGFTCSVLVSFLSFSGKLDSRHFSKECTKLVLVSACKLQAFEIRNEQLRIVKMVVIEKIAQCIVANLSAEGSRLDTNTNLVIPF